MLQRVFASTVECCSMAETYPCPHCGEEYALSGLHGHLRFQAGKSSEEATRLLEQVKRQHGEQAPGQEAEQATETAGEGVTSSIPAGLSESASETTDDGFGEVSEHVKRRLSETADVAASMRMLEALNEDRSEDGEEEQSPASELAELAEAAKAFRELTGGGESGPDESEIRQIVREESERQPAADGGARNPVTEALAAGVDDPDTLREISKLSPQNRVSERKWNTIERLVSNVDGELIGTAVKAVTTTLRSRRPAQQQPQQQRAQPDSAERRPQEPREPRETEGEAESKSRARERLGQIQDAGSEGGENDESE